VNIKTLDELLDLKGYQQRLMAIDLGDKTIGVSMSDQSWVIANPVTVVQRTSFRADIQTIVKYIEDYRVCAVIVGLPRNMNGTHGPQAEKMRAFAVEIMENTATPVALWDERLSTMAVSRTMLAADLSRARRAQVVDKLAATFILQGVLDYLSLLERRREAMS
jgi:putative holliday junction resolvase